MTTLQEYTGAPDKDTGFITESETQAQEMLDAYIADNIDDPATLAGIPESILDLARLDLGAELYSRRVARLGAGAFEGGSTTARPTPADPRDVIRPLLAPYIDGPIA